MIDHIVVDVEICREIEELPHGWGDTHLMGVSCAVVYEHTTDRFRVYDERRQEELRARISAAQRVTTFNGWGFDFPVIWQKESRERVNALAPTSDDILQRVWSALAVSGHGRKGWSLDLICQATIGRGKIDSGAHAPVMYKAGYWGDLVTYCIDDVALTRDLCAFVEIYGYLCSAAYPGVKLYLTPWAPANFAFQERADL